MTDGRTPNDGGGRGDQAYSRFSTTGGHTTDCKLDPAVYVDVCVVTSFGPVLFEPNDLGPTGLGCQPTDPIPPQVRLTMEAGTIP